MYEDPHYTFDEETREITFNTSHRYYIIERDVFAANGIDIDKIKTIDIYYDYTTKYRKGILELFQLKMKNKTPTTLEGKFARSVIIDDTEEIERLGKLLDKRNDAGIKIIK